MNDPFCHWPKCRCDDAMLCRLAERKKVELAKQPKIKRRRVLLERCYKAFVSLSSRFKRKPKSRFFG